MTVGAQHNLMNADERAIAMLEVADRIADELTRLNDNLESGRALLRTHTTNCVAPPREDFTIRQLEVMSKFLHNAIETGALVLPAKDDGRQS